MREIPLHGKKAAGRVALIDDADFELVSAYSWWVHERRRPGGGIDGPYAVTIVHRGADGRPRGLRMHKLITGWPQTDHEDHNGLNNQRGNLRPATDSQNQANRGPQTGGSSEFKGVSWRRDCGKWHVRIKVDGRKIHLGYFTEEEEAALAYDEAAREYFGEFARPNFPAWLAA